MQNPAGVFYACPDCGEYTHHATDCPLLVIGDRPEQIALADELIMHALGVKWEGKD